MVQWLVFGGVWAGLVIVSFIIVGSYSHSAVDRMNAEAEAFDPRRSHLLLIETSSQLFVVQLLLAGILAALIALLLR